jgi:FKBP-type peptidyl-prolyl cis-trans isomerase
MPPLDAPNWKVVAPGVAIWDVKQGDGDRVQAVDWLKVRYLAWLASNGRVVLNTMQAKELSDLTLAEQISGWQKGLLGMAVGGVRRLKLEPEQAYGAKGLPPHIPPHAALVFEIDLVFTDGP